MTVDPVLYIPYPQPLIEWDGEEEGVPFPPRDRPNGGRSLPVWRVLGPPAQRPRVLRPLRDVVLSALSDVVRAQAKMGSMPSVITAGVLSSTSTPLERKRMPRFELRAYGPGVSIEQVVECATQEQADKLAEKMLDRLLDKLRAEKGPFFSSEAEMLDEVDASCSRGGVFRAREDLCSYCGSANCQKRHP